MTIVPYVAPENDRPITSEKLGGKIFTGGELKLDNSLLSSPSIGHRLLEKLSNENANTIIYIDAESGRQWTGTQLKEKILNIATVLIDQLNFEQGTVVCINYDNCDLTCILGLAIIFAGGIVSCSLPKDPYAELLYLARKVEPKILFCHQKNLHLARQLEADMGYSIVGISMDGIPELFTRFQHFEHLLNYDHTKSKSLSKVPVACKDISRDIGLIMMSSGTTGKPKAIPVTHKTLMIDLSGRFSDARRSKGIKFPCVSSLDYVSGRLILFSSIEVGYTAVIMNGFEPKKYLETIEKYRCNLIYLGAAAFYNMIKYKDIDKYNISSVKVVFPMGAKIIYLDELREFFSKHSHIIQVKQGYGASEICGGAMNGMTPDEYLNDCDNCGKLIPGIEAKIVDIETNELLGPNQRGLLHISGVTKFSGYYDAEYIRKKNKNHSDLNSSSPSFIADSTIFDKDGFYITGDIGYFNENEQLYIIGRHKELMSCRSSKKVVPQELEELLSEHPAVSKACVLGMPNKRELTLHCPRAFIVVKQNYYNNEDESEIVLSQRLNQVLIQASAKDDAVLEHCGNDKHEFCSLLIERRRQISEDIMIFMNERIGWEKQLTGGIVILDCLPETRTGKINKSWLRSLTIDQVEIYGDRSG